MTKNERAHLDTIQCILDEDECSCTDPPCLDGDDHAAEHGQYCPVYLAAYLGALLAGKRKPDPDTWQSAPEHCSECDRSKRDGRPRSCRCHAASGAEGGE